MDSAEERKTLSRWQRAILNSNLPPTTRHVLLTISIYLNPNGEGAWPSVRRLADDTGRSKTTVSKHILIAESRGYLKIHQDRGYAKGWRKNNYSVRFPKGVPATSIDRVGVPVS